MSHRQLDFTQYPEMPDLLETARFNRIPLRAQSLKQLDLIEYPGMYDCSVTAKPNRIP